MWEKFINNATDTNILIRVCASMYKYIKLISIIAVALMLSSSIITIQVVSANSNNGNTWTFMVYIVADNNLDPYAELDLREMESVGSTSSVNIVALVDLLNVNGSVLYYIGKGSRSIIWGNWSSEYELNMGDPEALAWFVNETVRNYPADHYVLVLWDHGDGWNGFGWDDTNNDHLTIEEIKEALSNIPVKIDILGFDACLMSNLEVIYTLSLTSKVEVVIASEEFIPNYGWPYDKILEKLVENPDISIPDFAKVIVEEYVKSYSRDSQGFAPYATLSAVDASVVGVTVSQLKNLTSILIKDINKYKSSVKASSEDAERFWFGMWRQGPYIDLKDFLLNLLTLEKNLKPYIEPILSNWDNLVIACNSTRGPHADTTYGLTIYFPRNRNQFYYPEPYYSSVPEFANETGWYQLLNLILK